MSEPSGRYSAPDGMEFSDKVEYQNYVMDHFYQTNSDTGADFSTHHEHVDIKPYNASNSYLNMEDSDSEHKNIAAYSVEEYIGDLRAQATSLRPQSAPAGKRGHGEVTSETFTPKGSKSLGAGLKLSTSQRVSSNDDGDVQISETLKLPSSPYDEEVAFEYRADDDEDLDSAYLDSRRGSSSAAAVVGTVGSGGCVPGTALTSDQHWQEENRRYLMASTEADIPPAPRQHNQAAKSGGLRPRPSSADPRLRHSGIQASNRPSSAGRFGSSFNNNSALSTRRERYSLSAGPAGRTESPYSSRQRGSSADARLKFRDIAAQTSTEKLGAMKELLEDLVRSTVKKADLYHMIQVSLGFIEDYTMIPPRGAIITGKKKPWLTSRDIQAAFIAARLSLTEPQLIILRSLVHTFAKQYDSLYGDASKSTDANTATATTEAAVDGSAVTKKGVFGPSQTLSSDWLKKYLVHLRLSKKVVSASATGSAAAASTAALPSSAATGSMGAVEKPPLPWSEWLGRKMQGEVKRDAVKPRDFEKALNGQPHPLNKEDIELMLRTYNVLPAETLQQEVECRIEAWLLDMDGRRDFQHALNVKIRHWIWKKKIDDKIKLPVNEKGYWQIWQKLPDEEKKSVKAEILNTIIQEKRAELLTKERTKQFVTKELYWKFDLERQKKECKWSTWLPDHITKFKRDLEDFRRTEQDRLQRLATIQSKRKTVAGLSEVQNKLKKVQDDYQMDSYHQIELQKAINALRRSAVIGGVAKGTVITKEDFDKHIKGILAPYIVMDGDGTLKADAPTTRPQSSGRGIQQSDLQGMFHNELKVAVDKVVELEKARTEKASKAYQDWVAEKIRKQEELAQKKLDAEAAKKKQKELRDKKNKKEYKKWCSLRSKDQYRSKVDNKPHPVPAAMTITHKDRWNVDKELHEYYADIEKRY